VVGLVVQQIFGVGTLMNEVQIGKLYQVITYFKVLNGFDQVDGTPLWEVFSADQILMAINKRNSSYYFDDGGPTYYAGCWFLADEKMYWLDLSIIHCYLRLLSHE